MNKKFKIYSGLVALFILGAVIGSLGTGIYIRNEVAPFYEGGPMKRRAMMLDRWMTRLNLTSKQKVEVETIIEQTQNEFIEFRRKHRPEMKKIMEKRFALIREKLNPDQQETLDEIQKRMQERMKHRMKGHKGRGSFPGGPSMREGRKGVRSFLEDPPMKNSKNVSSSSPNP